MTATAKHGRRSSPSRNTCWKACRSSVAKFLAVYMQDVASHVYAYDLSGKRLYEVKLPGLGSISGFSGDEDEPEAFYTFTSFTCPPAIYRFDADSNTSELFRRSEVDFNPDDYVCEQVFYPSKDGTKVPMFLTYKKGLVRDGNNPVMLYGYGGLQHQPYARFQSQPHPLPRKRGHLRLGQPAGRRRIRRSLAPGRHEDAEAERVRRLHRRRRIPHRRGVDLAQTAGH